jgi:hypothetical protein
MCAVLRATETQQKARSCKPNHLSIETRGLMMLEYWREYRTYFHIGGSYSGKKKRYTLKTQIVVDKADDKIIHLAYGKGRCHDFRLFKGKNVRFHPGTQAIIDAPQEKAFDQSRQTSQSYHHTTKSAY